jgi:uridine phosphorylase
VSRKVYHLALDERLTEGAEIALMPGDPGRVPKLAYAFDPQAREIAHHREYRTFLGRCRDQPVLVVSTGIGGPSASIAVDELAQLGAKTFIRVGTCGAIAPEVQPGDVVITTGAVRLDGASLQYAPIEYPAVAHYEIVGALAQAARALKLRHHVGITVSTATFYPGQERTDSHLRYVPRAFQGIGEEWQRLGALNYEMESATILTLAAAFRLRAGCVTGVVVHREEGEEISPQALLRGEENAMAVAAKALELLLA